jgi:hypothetical protein
MLHTAGGTSPPLTSPSWPHPRRGTACMLGAGSGRAGHTHHTATTRHGGGSAPRSSACVPAACRQDKGDTHEHEVRRQQCICHHIARA